MADFSQRAANSLNIRTSRSGRALLGSRTALERSQVNGDQPSLSSKRRVHHGSPDHIEMPQVAANHRVVRQPFTKRAISGRIVRTQLRLDPFTKSRLAAEKKPSSKPAPIGLLKSELR